MSESGDYTPGAWKGHDWGYVDFGSAHSAYKADAGRSYAKAKEKKVARRDLLPKVLRTESDAPLVIVTDETGSMEDWPATMFSKLPYMDHEVRKEYLGDDAEIAWCAVGDAENREDYPVQARPFAKGEELAKRIKEIVLEGKGGGNGGETYELMALYLVYCVEMPNAVTPVCIFICDELPFESVTVENAANYCGVTLERKLSTDEIFAMLRRKYSVYAIRKPYGSETSEYNKRANARWAQLVGGEERVAHLDDPNRVVDVIFRILGHETGKLAYSDRELVERQGKDADGQAKIAKTRMAFMPQGHIEAPQPAQRALPSGKSRTRGIGSGTPTKPLI